MNKVVFIDSAHLKGLGRQGGQNFAAVFRERPGVRNEIGDAAGIGEPGMPLRHWNWTMGAAPKSTACNCVEAALHWSSVLSSLEIDTVCIAGLCLFRPLEF